MEAFLYEKLKNHEVRCSLCRHRCLIEDNKRGICRVRENRRGSLITLVYDKVIARHVDPIEKKPLFHFMPGSLSYSIAAPGCNFKCAFCQNADIAQMPADRQGIILGESFTPEALVDDAIGKNCKTIAYTYTEPTVYFELAFHTARLAHDKGLKNIFVTNGYMTPEALDRITPYLDGANVDLKAFNESFYQRYCRARLEPVKETLREMKKRRIFIEVTTLLIPGLNDDEKELEKAAHFIVEGLGEETPWHISRFHPTYKLTDRPRTPAATLINAREIGLKAGLRYVYTGNAPGENGEHTFCGHCGKTLIERWGFSITGYFLKNGCCDRCGVQVDGIGM